MIRPRLAVHTEIKVKLFFCLKLQTQLINPTLWDSFTHHFPKKRRDARGLNLQAPVRLPWKSISCCFSQRLHVLWSSSVSFIHIAFKCQTMWSSDTNKQESLLTTGDSCFVLFHKLISYMLEHKLPQNITFNFSFTTQRLHLKVSFPGFCYNIHHCFLSLSEVWSCFCVFTHKYWTIC